MGKSYWITVLHSAVDDKERELEKEVQPEIDVALAEKRVEWLANYENAPELYESWIKWNEEVEAREKAVKEAKKQRDRIRERFYDAIEATPYYSHTAPTEYVTNEVRKDAIEEVMSATPQGAEIKRLKSIRPRISVKIEAARTEKSVMDAVSALAEMIGVDIGI